MIWGGEREDKIEGRMFSFFFQAKSFRIKKIAWNPFIDIFLIVILDIFRRRGMQNKI